MAADTATAQRQAKQNSLTIEQLRAALHYDPGSGVFTRLLRTAKRVRVGNVAGWVDNKGYVRIRLYGRCYRAHRLVWFYMTGEWPKDQIDHKDLDKANNRWTNLREATNSQNMANSRTKASNTTGWKGVHWNRNCRKWHAQTSLNGKNIYLGLFDCPAAAHFAYLIATDKAFGGFARAS
jgi:hypothetical protein